MKLQVNQRAEFSKILSRYKEMGKGNVRLAQSSLILTQAIDAGKSNYLFPVLENDPNPFPQLEKRLNINDEFITTEMGIYLIGEATPLPVVIGAPSQFIWLAAPPYELSMAGALQQEALYNGDMKIDVNNITYLEKWDVRKHRYVGVTQWKNFSAGIPQPTEPSIDFSGSPMYPTSPMITLSGAKKNNITLNLPQPIQSFLNTWLEAAGAGMRFNVNRIAVKFHGFLAQNAAKFQ